MNTMNGKNIPTPRGRDGTMIRRYTTDVRAVLDLQRLGAEIRYRYKNTIVATFGCLKLYCRIGCNPLDDCYSL